MSNLAGQIEWAKTREEEVKKIIRSANRLVDEQLNNRKVDRYIYRILTTLSHYQDREMDIWNLRKDLKIKLVKKENRVIKESEETYDLVDAVREDHLEMVKFLVEKAGSKDPGDC